MVLEQEVGPNFSLGIRTFLVAISYFLYFLCYQGLICQHQQDIYSSSGPGSAGRTPEDVRPAPAGARASRPVVLAAAAKTNADVAPRRPNSGTTAARILTPFRPLSTSPPENDWPPTGPYHARVRTMLKFVWTHYEQQAFGRDDIDPKTGKGGTWAGLGVFLVDGLDTLYIMGLQEEFDRAVGWVRDRFLEAETTARGDQVREGALRDESGPPPPGREVRFGLGSTFEITIRALGGLVGAYSLSGEVVLLEKAVTLAELLLKRAFVNAAEILPRKMVDIIVMSTPATAPAQQGGGSPSHKSSSVLLGEATGPGAVDEQTIYKYPTGLAEAGTLQLEFRTVANEAGRPELAVRPDRAFDAIARASIKSERPLLPTCIQQWSRDEVRSCAGPVSMGGAADSYYEYLLKLYLQGVEFPSTVSASAGRRGERGNIVYRDLWLQVVRTMRKDLVARSSGGRVFLAHKRSALAAKGDHMEHLECFVPGMLMLGADRLERELSSKNSPAAQEKGGSGSAGSGSDTSAEDSPKARRPPETTTAELDEFRLLAAQLTETCYDMYRMSPSGLAGEETQFELSNAADHDDGGVTADEIVLPNGVRIPVEAGSGVAKLFAGKRHGGKPGRRLKDEMLSSSEAQHKATGDKSPNTTTASSSSVPGISRADESGVTYSSLLPDMRFPKKMAFNILRPETVEALYYMHYFTGDEKYVEWGKRIFDSFVKHSKGTYGMQPLEELWRSGPVGAADGPRRRSGFQESFFVAETLKYFYLLFLPTGDGAINNGAEPPGATTPGGLDLGEWVITTEAHPVRVVHSGEITTEAHPVRVVHSGDG